MPRDQSRKGALRQPGEMVMVRSEISPTFRHDNFLVEPQGGRSLKRLASHVTWMLATAAFKPLHAWTMEIFPREEMGYYRIVYRYLSGDQIVFTRVSGLDMPSGRNGEVNVHTSGVGFIR